VFSTIAVVDFPTVIRIRSALQKLLHQVHGVVQVVVVHITAVDMDLTLEFGSEGFPVAFEDVAQVVVIAPILCYLPV